MIRIFMVGYSTRKGGIETYISNLVHSMDLNRYEFIMNEPVMNIDGKVWKRPDNRHNPLKWVLFWRKFFKECHFDVLYYNTCDIVSIDILRFAKAAGVPVRIIHSHSSGIMQGIETKISLFHRFTEMRNRKVLLNYATHLLACSEAAGRYLYGEKQKYEVVKNGIPLDAYIYSHERRANIRKELLCSDGDLLIGAIGSLSPAKNVLYSLDVFRTILDRQGNVKCIFVGDGEKRTELVTAIKQKGLRDKVLMVGSVNNVNEWVSALDCLVMPSIFEGLPFALVEAQAAGLHCVVSTGVPKESDLTGLLTFVSLDETKERWADEVLKACNKPRKDTKQQLEEAGYSTEVTGKNIMNLIEKALADVEKNY